MQHVTHYFNTELLQLQKVYLYINFQQKTQKAKFCGSLFQIQCVVNLINAYPCLVLDLGTESRTVLDDLKSVEAS